MILSPGASDSKIASSLAADRWQTLIFTGDWTEDDGSISMNRISGRLIFQHFVLFSTLEELMISERHFDEK